MEEKNKENNITSSIYAKLNQDQMELTNYLAHIRRRPKVNKIVLSIPKHLTSQQKVPLYEKKNVSEVKGYVELYLKQVKEIMNFQNFLGRKIILKLIKYLEEFPTLKFLMEKSKNGGKIQKKLCMNKCQLMCEVNDEMVPLFQKILQKVQVLKKQSEGKKLLQLGHRIAHLKNLVESVPNQHVFLSTNSFKLLDQTRIEKYLAIQENINRAQKSYGRFSENFHKNHQIFSNINRAYLQIAKSRQQICF